MSEQAGQGFDRSEPNVRLIAIFGAGTLVLLVISVLALQYYYDRVLEEQVFVKVQEPVSQTLMDVRAREDEALHSYRYLDREKGTIRLPIERGMELLATEAAQGKLKYPQRAAPVEIQGGANVPK